MIKILTISIDVTEELDFINRLVEVVLVVFDNLHADHLLSVDIVALDGFGESRAA